jgi:hypothetical protein
MPEAPRSPADLPPQSPEGRPREHRGLDRFFRLLATVTGMAALLDLLIGRRPPRQPPPEPAPAPAPVGEALQPGGGTSDGDLHRDPRHPERDEIRYPDGRIEHPHVRSEHRDVTLRPVVISLLAAMCFAALAHWIILKFFYSYRDYQQEIKQSAFPVAPSPAVTEDPRRIPEPRLEPVDRLAGVEKANVFERELAKEKVLHSYGRTEETGYVHVPIERAMERLANQLPVREGGATKTNRYREDGLIDAGESNSGRMFRGKRK